jgi:hypothetical protein
VYCEDGCHDIKPKYRMPRVQSRKTTSTAPRENDVAVHLK